MLKRLLCAAIVCLLFITAGSSLDVQDVSTEQKEVTEPQTVEKSSEPELGDERDLLVPDDSWLPQVFTPFSKMLRRFYEPGSSQQFKQLESLHSPAARHGAAVSPLSGAQHLGLWQPLIDVSEDDKQYKIHAELPGVAKEHIQLELLGNTLHLHADKESTRESGDKTFHRSERVYGSCHRSFWLPDDADTRNIHASYANGVLDVNVPKLPEFESHKPSRIDVQ